MELTLKTSWSAVTIADYMNYKNALDNPNTNEFEKNLDVLAIILGVDRATLMPLPAGQILPLLDRMSFLITPPTSDPRSYYDIGGRKFKLVMNVKDLTAGQFIDLSHYTKDPELVLDNLHSICATLLIPVKPYKGKKSDIPVEKYGETPVNETAEFLYNNMSIEEAIGISSFFTLLYDLFTQITKRFLETEMRIQLSKASKMLKPETITKLM